MENKEVRELIKKKSLKHYQVAQEIGIASFTLSVWLRTPLTEERKKRILEVIEQMANNDEKH